MVKNIFGESSARPADIFFGQIETQPSNKRIFHPVPWIASVAVLFLISYFLIHGIEQHKHLKSISGSLQTHKNQLAQLENKWEIQNVEAERFNRLIQSRQEERKDLLARQAFLRKNVRRGRATSLFLAMMARKMPSSLHLEKIILQGNDLEIQGVAENTKDLSTWVESLPRAGLIRHISISSTVSSNIRPSATGEFILNAESIS